MVDIEIEKINEVYFKINCLKNIKVELHNFLSCKAPNFWFHPLFKQKLWDGSVHFFNISNSLLPIGLLPNFLNFISKYNYTYEFKFDIDILRNHIDEEHLNDFYNKIFSKTDYFPRDYQHDIVYASLKNKRGCLEAPTGSGKSICFYTIIRLLLETKNNILLIVPNISLVSQAESDFKEYGWKDADKYVNILYSGKHYDEKYPVLISTWQSLINKEDKFFKRFTGLIVDECVHPNTKILMSNEKEKSIKDIKIGDKVKSFNIKTKKIENKSVKKIFKNISQVKNNIFEIELEDRRKLIITGNHKVKTKLGDIKVEDLKEGDDLIVT